MGSAVSGQCIRTGLQGRAAAGAGVLQQLAGGGLTHTLPHGPGPPKLEVNLLCAKGRLHEEGGYLAAHPIRLCWLCWDHGMWLAHNVAAASTPSWLFVMISH